MSEDTQSYQYPVNGIQDAGDTEIITDSIENRDGPETNGTDDASDDSEGHSDGHSNGSNAVKRALSAPDPSMDRQFNALLDYLKHHRGFDFSGYKRSSLMRRIEKRMQDAGVASCDTYIDYLEVHPDEFAQLFNMILINVTAFFRDTAAWEFVTDQVIPRILAGKAPDGPIRIWSAGCSSGEETYTLAIILAEALGFDAFRERVKIYATDIDEEALAQARQASYTTREVSGVPPELVEKYFEESANRYTFHKDLRRAVIFGRHDLLKDAPISRIDLLVCRNAMMYFNAEVQAQVLQRFHFALNDNGCLFLGKAEMLFTHASLFTPLDLKRRVFVKTLKGPTRDRSSVGSAANNGSAASPLNDYERTRERVFDMGPVAQIVVDLGGGLTLANERARTMFQLGPRDVGRMLQDLEMSYRPVELRSRIEQAYVERRPVEIKDVVWQPIGTLKPTFLDIQVLPIVDPTGCIMGAAITFADVTRYTQLQQDLEDANRELETAYEELQSTNEELETTNEELQSTVEELETTNEELQSTNEELETMNEELQSTNEELQTINEELQTRSGELNQVNAFLSSILASLRGGVVVVDRDLHIQVWNHKASDLWGLRSDEVQGKHLLNLDFGLPGEELKVPIRACLSGLSPYQEATLSATNRRGRSIECKVSCTPLLGQGEEIIGAILRMEEM